MIGNKLQAWRQELGMTAERAASESKIPLRFLKALEEERFDLFGGWVYVRDYGARYLKFLQTHGQEWRDLLRRDWEIALFRREKSLPEENIGIRLRRFLPRRLAVFFGSAAGLAIVGYFAYQISSLAAPPRLLIVSPPGKFFQTHESFIVVRGRTRPEARAAINNRPALVEKNGTFSERLYLREGVNRIDVAVSSANGKSSYKTFYVASVP